MKSHHETPQSSISEHSSLCKASDDSPEQVCNKKAILFEFVASWASTAGMGWGTEDGAALDFLAGFSHMTLDNSHLLPKPLFVNTNPGD